jgi:hypothetical protein
VFSLNVSLIPASNLFSPDVSLYLLENYLFSIRYNLNGAAMSLLSYIRSIYQLDTLDTRFTSSSTTPYKPRVNAQTDPIYPKSSGDLPQGIPVKLDSNGRPIAQPSKWNTPEFYFYYFCFITIVPYMFWVAYDVSRRWCSVISFVLLI